MEGIELDLEEFLSLVDNRGLRSSLRWVEGIGDRCVSVKSFDDFFEDLLVVCYSRMDDCICG